MNYDAFLNTAKDAALKAGKLLMDNFSEEFTPEYKSAHDIGIDVDRKSEQIILEIINKSFPDHNIYSEESGESHKESDYTWYIDPLDGTNNYFAGIAYFGVSIALKFKDELIVGLVYNPVTSQMYEASKGGGAYLNGNPIKPASPTSLEKAVLSFVKGHYTYSDEALRIKSEELEQELENSVRRKLSMWAPALDWCLAASGKIDGIISYESELEDQYAGTLIAMEAGLNVTGFNGEPYTTGQRKIVASSGELHASLLKIVKNYT